MKLVMVWALIILQLQLNGGGFPPAVPPGPPPDPDSPFDVPSGPLPWALPEPPQTNVELTAPVMPLDPIEHLDDYEDQQAAVDDDADTMIGPLATLTGEAEDLKDALPDLSTPGDFSTGLAPEGETVAASDVAAEFAEHLVLAWRYARAASQMGLGSTGYLVTFLLIGIAWFLFVEFVALMIQIIIALVDFAVKAVEFIKGLAMALIAGA